MKRLLVVLLVIWPVAAEAQAIRRPPSGTGEICNECRTTCAIASQAVCDACIAAYCGSQFTRLAPERPYPIDPWMMDYRLPKAIGVTQIAHEPHPARPEILHHFTNMDVAWDMRQHGFRAAYLWIDNHPFDGDDHPLCYDLYGDRDPREGDWWCEYDGIEWDSDTGRYLIGESNPQFEDMIEFWKSAPLDVIFVRFHRWGYSEGACMALTQDPYYAITKRLYELIGDREITIVFSPWEQDWWPWGCDDGDGNPDNWRPPFEYANSYYETTCVEQCQEFDVAKPESECRDECGLMLVRDRYYWLEDEIERRQVEVERARREAYLARGHRPKLRVMTAVTLNRYPNNQRDYEKASGIPMLAERISGLTHKPDLIGLSYWLNGYDPIETLDWVEQVTGYPRDRIFISEFGATEDNQVQRFTEYIPVFREWGVRIINIWMWRQTWHDPGKNRGLWKQITTEGRVEWGEPTDGYYVLRDIIDGIN